MHRLIIYFQASKTAQELVNNAALNSRSRVLLYLGVAGAVATTLVALWACHRYTQFDKGCVRVIVAINMSYIFTMIFPWGAAREPEFWALTAFVWLAYLLLTRTRLTANGLTTHVLQALALQIITYLWREYITTDHTFNSIDKTFVIWALCSTTYVTTSAQSVKTLARLMHHSPFYILAAGVGALSLSLVSFVLKVVSTAHYMPGQVPFVSERTISALQQIDQVLLAQTFFLGLVAAFALLCFSSRFEEKHQSSAGMMNAPRLYNELLINKRTDITSVVLEILNLFLISISRVSDIPLFLVYRFQLSLLGKRLYHTREGLAQANRVTVSSLQLTPFETGATAIILGECSLYATGRRRNIESLDISNAFHGLHRYSAIIVPIQTLVSNLSGPLWWAWNARRLLQGNPRAGSSKEFLKWIPGALIYATQSLFMGFGLCALMAHCLSMLMVGNPALLWSMAAPRFASALITVPVSSLAISILCLALSWARQWSTT